MEDDYYEEDNGRFKKFLIPFIGILILIIFITYIFTNAAGIDVLGGLISSSKLKENEVDFSLNGKVIFDDKTLDELKNIYFENLRNEFKVCLYGKKENNLYFINKLAVPKTYSKTFNQVIAEPCSDEALISLHSHPYKRCLPSEQDFETFSKFKEKTPNALMVIMCEENRFYIYD